MKLLILAYEYPPIGGGTGQALERMLRAWPKDSGREIEIWTASPPKGVVRNYLEGVQYLEFGCAKKRLHYWRLREQLFLLWKIWRKTLGDDPFPDAVLVWGGWPLGILLLGALGEVPSLLALRGSDVPGFSGRTSGPFWRFLAKRVWKRAGLVTANSPALKRMAQLAAPRQAIEVIPNGIALPEESTFKEPKDSWTEENPLRILAVNRLVSRKRIDWILTAFSHLPPEFRARVYLTIAGDGPERYRLETMSRELNLQTRVNFLGEVPSEAMTHFYNASDLFVLASEAEGLSNALLEAMAHGLPCLCATATGFSDIDDATLRTDRPERIAQQIRLLMNDPERLTEYGDRSRTIAANYSWEGVAARYSTVLKLSIEEVKSNENP